MAVPRLNTASSSKPLPSSKYTLCLFAKRFADARFLLRSLQSKVSYCQHLQLISVLLSRQAEIQNLRSDIKKHEDIHAAVSV